MSPYEIAKGEIGTHEVKGGENPRILEYHDCTTLNACEDEVPWCSAFANWCHKQAGIEGTHSAAARSWLKWGKALEMPVEGCIVILKRGNDPNSGHVGFYVKSEGEAIIVLGGNQSDQVKESRFAKKDVLGYREA